MALRILIHGINYAPEFVGIGRYTGELGAWLGSRGHAVTVLTAPPYYPAVAGAGGLPPPGLAAGMAGRGGGAAGPPLCPGPGDRQRPDAA